MAEDPKSIGKSLSEIASILKEGNRNSKSNQGQEKVPATLGEIASLLKEGNRDSKSNQGQEKEAATKTGEIASILKEGNRNSKSNQGQEKEAAAEETRSRSKLFESLKDSMDKLGKGFTDLVGSSGVKKSIFAPLFMLMLPTISKLKNSFGTIKLVIATITKGFSYVTKMFKTFSGKGGIIGKGLTFIGKMLKPIFGKSGIIGGVISKILLKLKPITRMFKPLFSFFGKGGALGKLASKFSFFGMAGGPIAKLGLKFLGPLIMLIDGFVGFFKGWTSSPEGNIGLRIIDGIVGGLAQILSGLTLGFLSFDAITEFIQPVVDYVKDWFTGIFAIWDDESIGFGEKLWLTLKAYFTLLWDALKLQFVLLKDGIFLAIEGLMYLFSPESLMAAGKFVIDTFMGIGKWLYGVFERPISYMSMIMDQVMSAMKMMYYTIMKIIAEKMEGLGMGWMASKLGVGSAADAQKEIDAAQSDIVQAAVSHKEVTTRLDKEAAENDEKNAKRKADAIAKRDAENAERKAEKEEAAARELVKTPPDNDLLQEQRTLDKNLGNALQPPQPQVNATVANVTTDNRTTNVSHQPLASRPPDAMRGSFA